MVATRALRSTRSLDAESAASHANDQALQKDISSSKTKNEPSEKARGSPHVKSRSPPTKTASQTRRSSSPKQEVGEEEDAGGDENADDEDNVDVNAPPRDKDVPVDSIEQSAAPKSSQPVESLAGLTINTKHEETMNVDENSSVSQETNKATEPENVATGSVSAIDLYDDGSDSDMSNFEIADDDDDYDGVDNISIASDDSRQFEADVEREIQAAGEEAIDWDDENTYHYENTLNDDIYGFAHESGMSQSLLGLDLFNFEHNLDARLTQSTPNLQDLGGQITKLDQAISENMLKLERSVASDSDDTSVTGAEEAKPAENSKPALKMNTSLEDEGDTTDEDISWTTVSSPGVTLSRENSRLDRKTPKTKKAKRMPRKQGLSLRKIPPHPEKAIAYSVAAPFGSTVKFCTPRTKSYRWMDVRGRNSRHSSGTSSPTMINLEDAYTRGNTRTGAHITDVINGSLFSALHCRGDSIGELMNTDESSVSKFYQPLLKDKEEEETPSKPQLERPGATRPLEESALALIDFTGGVTDDVSLSGDESMGIDSDQLDDETQKTPRISVADCAIDEEDLAVASELPGTQTTSVPGLRIPMTPPPELDLLMGESQTSPKKRRMSNRSNGRRSVSPAVKKQRYDASGKIIV